MTLLHCRLHAKSRTFVNRIYAEFWILIYFFLIGAHDQVPQSLLSLRLLTLGFQKQVITNLYKLTSRARSTGSSQVYTFSILY